MKRRTLLGGAAACGLGAAAFWRGSHDDAPTPAFRPVAAPQGPSAPPLDAADARFAALSAQLTGHEGLSPVTAQRIAAACRLRDPQFDATVAHWTAGSANEGLAQTIVAAWYLGQVGEAPTTEAPGDRGRPETTRHPPTVTTYEQALMWAPVADVLSVPSYCHGACGAWAEQPPAT